MFTEIKPTFTELSEFASASAGGKVLFATDDFFAPCENLISDSEPVFLADRFTEFGKWMDGWETRRKRIAGHDWAIIKLAAKCVIKGLLVDTAFFTGNYAPRYSIQAACLTPEEEALIPVRSGNKMGTACGPEDLAAVERLRSAAWDEIVPVTALRPGYEDSRRNYQKVVSDDAYTHLRVNMFPDGGIARLRVYGDARPRAPPPHHLTDLMSLLQGATCQGYSNAHYGHPRNMTKPGRSASMADGWETARRLDRPPVIQTHDDGTLNFPGEEWAVFKLGFPGTIKRICIDTAHFKGNFPDSVKIDGAVVKTKSGDWTPECNVSWKTILKPQKLSAHREHWYDCSSDVITHVRVTIAPDGGISRIRAFGHVLEGLH